MTNFTIRAPTWRRRGDDTHARAGEPREQGQVCSRGSLKQKGQPRQVSSWARWA
eukprot:CAMPEP_0119172194 /NCGR_PEP_ID=MMETSP1315-20130426/27910_1 /TAXON_ID=676789 /ORGANISM="Prasinoderma singularis, Strain RCC927" /LENGTH=53 /DNA_ID=CAMNT_0007166075 /DNA_START=34 /DNA_END=191 /DNA_ORIENTATION=-